MPVLPLQPPGRAQAPRPAPQAADSLAFWDAAHDVLTKKTTPEAAVCKLEGKLKLIKRDQW